MEAGLRSPPPSWPVLRGQEYGEEAESRRVLGLVAFAANLEKVMSERNLGSKTTVLDGTLERRRSSKQGCSLLPRGAESLHGCLPNLFGLN